jgi:WD40 repeat protein
VTAVAPAVPVGARTPWKGLAPYDDSHADAGLFFGRDREIAVACANLRAARLTVLFGASGVGKSSLLRAGVIRQLRDDGDVAVLVSSWTGDPVEAIASAARTAIEASLGHEVEDPSGSLAARLRAWADELGADLLLVLDQAEEYFLYHEGDSGPGTFAGEFPGLVTERGLRVNVLLGIREDALGQLDAFRAAVPGVLSNYLRLERLDRDAGRIAILGPIARWNEAAPNDEMTAEPALVEAVLDEVAAGRIEPEAGGLGGVTPSALVERIEAPYLQLVLERLWETERENRSAVLRLETLRLLGGAERIVEQHLERALAALDQAGRDAAAAVFGHLVTPSGTKIAHTVGDLSSYARLDRDAAAELVAELERARILRPADADRVEIYHDVLALAVGQWRREHEAARTLERERRRHRRVVVGLVASVIALAVVAGIAVYALTQRSEANEQARAAKARAFVSDAAASLERDPARSVRLALDAARLDPTPAAEEMLRQALLSPHQSAPPRRGRLPSNLTATGGGVRATADGRGVRVVDAGGQARRLNHAALVSAVDVSPDGRYVVTAGGYRFAKLWDARSGEMLQLLDGPSAPVLAAAFSPDGALVATGSVDSGVRLYDIRDGTVTATLLRHQNYVTDVDFSDDGAVLGSASLDRTARLWEVATGRSLGALAGHTGALVGVDVESLRSVTTQQRDRTLRTFDGRFEPQLRLLARLPAPVDAVRFVGGDMQASAVGTRYRVQASGEAVPVAGFEPVEDDEFRVDRAVVRLPSGIELRGHRRPITDATASADGRFVVTASRDNDARVWDAETGRLIQVLRGHFGPVETASFSPDGRWIVTGGPTTAGLWDAHSGTLVFFMRGHSTPVTAVAFDPATNSILTGSRDGEVRTVRCLVCGGLDQLVSLAEQRIALAEPRG